MAYTLFIIHTTYIVTATGKHHIWCIIHVMKSIIIVLMLLIFFIALPELVSMQIALKTSPGVGSYMAQLMDLSIWIMGLTTIVIPGILVYTSTRKN